MFTQKLASGLLAIGLACLAAVAGCGGGGPAESADGGQKLLAGETQCGNAICQAGRYCENSNSSVCLNGCASNNNCATGETCEKVGIQTIGTCKGGAAPVDCGAICDKLKVCSPDDFPGQTECVTKCNALSTTCKTCLSDAGCDSGPNACATECGG